MKKILVFAFLIIAFTACGGGTSSNNSNAGGGGGGGTGGGTVSGSDIQFNISDAVAILKVNQASAQIVKASSSGSNIYKLTTAGTIEDIFESVEPIIASTLYIAPDGKLYIVFQSAVTIGDQPCILIRLGRDNTGECVDDGLMQINTFSVPTKPIQFDAASNIYYSGYSSDSKGVLRKKNTSLSESTDLINDNIQLSHFLVTDDGTVYVAGTSTSTSTTFFRRILTSGSLENLLNGAAIQSLYELPDGNVYAGDWEQRFGVMKVTDAGLSDTLYIGYTAMNGIPYNADFYVDNNVYDSCTAANHHRYPEFCDTGGTMLSNYYRSPDDHVYVVVGSGDRASLWQYWPDIKPIDTSVYRPTIVSGTMTTLLIAGYDVSSKNKLISYNTGDQSEIDLLNGADIEIYHFSYSASTGRIIFDGLRFSDNKYIVGSIDTQSGNTLTVLESGIQYEDMQFFE